MQECLLAACKNQAMPVLRSDYTSVAGKGNVFEAGGQPVDMRASGGQTVPMLGGQPIINQPQVGMAQAQQSSAMQPVSTQVQPLTPATIGQAQQVQPAQQMQGGLRQGLGLLDQGYDRVQTAVGQGVNALQQGQDQSITALDQAQAQGLGRIDQSTGQAIDYLNPYADVGKSAINQEAALAGALGAEAQQQAINQFMESPAQQYNREQQEKALLRNATATGFGLRSGATLTELQKQASGISAQQQQQQLENIRNLAGRGQQAATTQGGYAQQGGVAGANLIGQIAGQKANVYGNQSGQIANMYGQQGAAGANLSSQGAGMANQAGQAIANQIGQTTGQLAGNQLNLGQLLAGLDQTTASNLSNLLTQGATQGSQTQMQLAQLLANLATGQGSQLANLTVGAGNAQAAGTVAGGGALRETVGTALGFLSDRNLKDNITLLVKGAVDLYSWTWKAIDSIPAHMHGALAIGVIAQDVEKSHPEAVSVSESGYLMVDYNKLSEAL